MLRLRQSCSRSGANVHVAEHFATGEATSKPDTPPSSVSAASENTSHQLLLRQFTIFLTPASARHDPVDTPYPAPPLLHNQIRLIRLLPGTWIDPIRCELYNIEHDTAQAKYQALSYVWGSTRVMRNILVNRTKFPVTVNLESALRHLREHNRHVSEEAMFWIDALCINQRDVEERTQQAQLMGDIYRRCRQVVVYLGDHLGD
jgi:hypothetical protein